MLLDYCQICPRDIILNVSIKYVLRTHSYTEYIYTYSIFKVLDFCICGMNNVFVGGSICQFEIALFITWATLI